MALGSPVTVSPCTRHSGEGLRQRPGRFHTIGRATATSRAQERASSDTSVLGRHGYTRGMEPIPETTKAVDEFGPFSEGDLLQTLKWQSQQVRAIVPDCVGLSLSSAAAGVTFTLVSSVEEVALLDALQYIAGGPCLKAVETQEVLVHSDDDPLDEERWQLFARGTAAMGVASTLSLPVLSDGVVVGSVNLYAASAQAFAGHHDELARLFGAWAPGAITNADLSFRSRSVAEHAPDKLRGEYHIEVAVGIIAKQQHLTPDAARKQFTEAAQRAGVTEAELAGTIIELRHSEDGDPSAG
jgi:GAF domain-containing protein